MGAQERDPMRHVISIVTIIVAACSSSSEATPTTQTTQPPANPANAAKPAPQKKPDDFAPSTGKEMPKAAAVDPAAHRAALARGVAQAEAAKDAAACDQVVDTISPAAVALGLKLDATTRPVFVALARCAREAHRYKVLELVARAAPSIVQASDLALAFYGQERYAEAAKELRARLTKTPKDPSLFVVAARLACKLRDFAKCRAAADQALAITKGKRDEEAVGAAARAHVARFQAAMMLGDYKAARESSGALPGEKARETLAKLLVPAERNQLAVDVRALAILPLGTYHLAGMVNRNLAELALGNGSRKDRQLRVTVEIPGVTVATVKNVVVLSKKVTTVAITPPFLAGFTPDSMTSPQRVQLDIKVADGDTVLFEQSGSIELLPRDYLPTFEKIGEDTMRPALHNAAAWVTPNDPAVEALLTAAKARLVGRQSFSGPQSASLPQVKAIYDELQARGVSYVMDPGINSDRFVGQRTRLPAQVIASTNAQCLEGTLLFASALEAIGLDPILVVVPGHAFIGWHASPADKTQRLFLETTMVHSAAFEAAVKKAVDRVATETKEGHFKNGMSQLLEIKELRAKGITPQGRGGVR